MLCLFMIRVIGSIIPRMYNNVNNCSDHYTWNNRIIDWDKDKNITSETNKFKRWIKEAIEIRRRASGTITRDEGVCTLSHTSDSRF